MSERLPKLPKAQHLGYVYVAKRGEKYKIGFTRHNIRRRLRNCGGELVALIPAGCQPSVLEYILNSRFADKRLPPQGTNPGDKREWFALDAQDVAWLQ